MGGAGQDGRWRAHGLGQGHTWALSGPSHWRSGCCTGRTECHSVVASPSQNLALALGAGERVSALCVHCLQATPTVGLGVCR
mmetsp:Transcript_29264/g.52636  ORF Transcript_29264/g.52636 Transcript_29264/m.52636 type:complete len:82 (+) Transcript_29264:881-1126(+)